MDYSAPYGEINSHNGILYLGVNFFLSITISNICLSPASHLSEGKICFAVLAVQIFGQQLMGPIYLNDLLPDY